MLRTGNFRLNTQREPQARTVLNNFSFNRLTLGNVIDMMCRNVGSQLTCITQHSRSRKTQHVSVGDTLPHTVVGVCGEFQRTGRFLQRGI